MANTIKLKNSIVTTVAPASLSQGEMGINITDKKLWIGDSSSAPVSLNEDLPLVNPLVTDYTETMYAANTGTAISLNLDNGTMQVLTLTGNATVTMPTKVMGKSFMVFVKTGVGGYTCSFTGVKWANGLAPSVTASASAMDIFSFFSDGTNWYGVTVGFNYAP